MLRLPRSVRSTLCLLTVATVSLAAAACGGGSSSGGDTAAPAGVVIRITGSDTMVNLVQAWAENYRKVKPDVSVQVAGGGSGV
ncbi:MAG: substrate-binding domain-containing protein, partial [Acidobacteria bacterium]|nr:substrate-binding domain-containing protein [Acidobacteriota bacterium]